jgi:hypothetical protein
MFAHLSIGSTNFEETLLRRDGAWTVLHRHAAPSSDATRWLHGARGPHRPAAAEAFDGALTRRTFPFDALPDGGDAVMGRLPLLVGEGVTVSCLRADSASETVTFTDFDGDQVVCVIEGGATLDTPCGTLRANPAEHVWIPRGMAHRWRVDKLGLRALVLEFVGELSLPPGSVNRWGQLGPSAPFQHRELHRPGWFARPHGAPEGVACVMRRGGVAREAVVTVDPLATTGWDGAVYPVSVAWEVPLTRVKEAVLFEGERSTLRTRIRAAPEVAAVAPGDRVTLALDEEGAAVVVWEPAGVAAVPAGPPGGIVVQLTTTDPLALTANGAALAHGSTHGFTGASG